MAELYDTIIEDLRAVAEHDVHRMSGLCEEIYKKIGRLLGRLLCKPIFTIRCGEAFCYSL